MQNSVGRFRLMGFFLIFVLLSAFGVTQGFGEELKLAHFVSPKHPMDRFLMRPWSEEVAKLANGSLTVRIYPAVSEEVTDVLIVPLWPFGAIMAVLSGIATLCFLAAFKLLPININTVAAQRLQGCLDTFMRDHAFDILELASGVFE